MGNIQKRLAFTNDAGPPPALVSGTKAASASPRWGRFFDTRGGELGQSHFPVGTSLTTLAFAPSRFSRAASKKGTNLEFNFVMPEE
jgi:hypothetical protein